MEHLEIISQIISSMGFPIFVSIYLLMYQRKENEQTREILNELKNAITILTENIKKEKE